MITSNIFRAYDIRGIVGKELTDEAVKNIGAAVGTQALLHQQDTLCIGRDGRLSSDHFISLLAQGILSTGCHVIDCGQLPTPLLYFATYALNTKSGVMLTGSHNPPQYNGMKMVIDQQTLSEERITDLYQLIITNQYHHGKGQLQQNDQIIDQYIHRICQDVSISKPLHIVIDCGNGIAAKVAPRLYRQLGCKVSCLFCEVDGHFPNHHPDPSDSKNLTDLINTVMEKKADIGLAFDGDGDRLGVVTNQGEIIWPDRQLLLYAQDVLSRNPGATIIYDVKSTAHADQFIRKAGGRPLMWKTGHSFIKKKLKQTNGLLAGEMSGHIFFKERWYGFDDALYSGARLLEILSKTNQTAEEVFTNIPNSVNTPELKMPVNETDKQSLMEKIASQCHFDNAKITTIDGIRADFSDGFGLVRASNTTPYLIFRFEAYDTKSLDSIKMLFREQLLAIDKTLPLPF